MHTASELLSLPNLDYVGQIWLAIAQMNENKLIELLTEDIVYEDVGKYLFITKLAERFENYKLMGNQELLINLDCCVLCHPNETVIKFIGDKTGDAFALYFQMNGNNVIDIYHCNCFGELNMWN